MVHFQSLACFSERRGCLATASKTTEIYSHLLPQQLHSEINKGLHQFDVLEKTEKFEVDAVQRAKRNELR